MSMRALLTLEDGRSFGCRSFTGSGEAGGEVVFNTSMTGYQEVLTDPSYRGQMVAMTYPLVGNYGVNARDIESDRIQVEAFLVREYQDFPSNQRAEGSLRAYLQQQGVLGVEQLDTRALTRHIRKAGAMRAFVSTEDLDARSQLRRLADMPPLEGRDLVRQVTASAAYRWQSDGVCPLHVPAGRPDASVWRRRDTHFAVAAFDFGIKYNILRCLEAVGCEVVVVPADTTAETIRAMQPDGIFLSNGPGDPAPLDYAVAAVRELVGYRPIFGICLGIQLLGLALGGRTFKLKFGHHGANQPVKNLATGRIEITSQNHGFAVDLDSLGRDAVQITHVNLNDDTLEGFRHRRYPIFAVQYHPEACPGPHDARYLFDDFRQMMAAGRRS